MTTAPKNAERIQNSDPRGRKHDNVPAEYFGPVSRRSRGMSLSGLRPSFFAMLRAEDDAKTPPNPKN